MTSSTAPTPRMLNIYITSCHLVCLYAKFNWVDILFYASAATSILLCQILYLVALGSPSRSTLWYTQLFWCYNVTTSTNLTLASLRVSPVHIGVASDQFLLAQIFLIDIEFNSDLWYFLMQIIYYRFSFFTQCIFPILRMKAMLNEEQSIISSTNRSMSNFTLAFPCELLIGTVSMLIFMMNILILHFS